MFAFFTDRQKWKESMNQSSALGDGEKEGDWDERERAGTYGFRTTLGWVTDDRI